LFLGSTSLLSNPKNKVSTIWAVKRVILKDVFLGYDIRLKKLSVDNTFKMILSKVKCNITPPLNFNIKQSYYNPAYPIFTRSFSVFKKSKISFEILNLIGQK